MTTPDASGGYLDANQLGHARVMVAAIRGRGLPLRAAVVVLETAWVESRLRIYANTNVAESMLIPHERVGTDHLSVGPLQQQVPSWGAAADCMDPAKSTAKFLNGAGDNPGLFTLPGYRFSYVGYPTASRWDQIPTGSAAQAVQVSAFPAEYQKVEAWAAQLASTLWGAIAPTPLPIPVAGNEVEDDEMILILNGGNGGQSGFFLSGGKALVSTTNGARQAHKAAGGRIEVWPAAEFSRALAVWK